MASVPKFQLNPSPNNRKIGVSFGCSNVNAIVCILVSDFGTICNKLELINQRCLYNLVGQFSYQCEKEKEQISKHLQYLQDIKNMVLNFAFYQFDENYHLSNEIGENKNNTFEFNPLLQLKWCNLVAYKLGTYKHHCVILMILDLKIKMHAQYHEKIKTLTQDELK